MRLVTAQEMQAIDRRTIDGGRVPALDLMERAGRAAAAEALRRLSPGSQVEILCGKGNNGGDGFVVARHLAQHGVRVCVHTTHASADLAPDARANEARLAGLGVEIRLLPGALRDPGPVSDARRRGAGGAGGELDEHLARADLCVDALLGTGVTQELRGRMAALVNILNRTSKQTLAVDMPSGIDATTGRVLGTAVWADATVTFGLPKLGLALHPGRERAGQLIVADIGFPEDIVEAATPPRYWVDAARAAALVPRLVPTAHKYERGCVLIVAGSRRFPGAAALAAEAALRGGAGLVYLAAPASMRPILQAKLTEVIVHELPETEAGTVGAGGERELAGLVERADAVAIGPGLGDQQETRAWVHAFLGHLALPAVVDADALPSVPAPPHPGPRIVTPHAGELARWIGAPARAVAAARLDVAVRSAAQQGVVVVAKGAPTAVATAEGGLYVNGSGNVGLATAGSGDVLTGLIAALVAQGLAAPDAAVLGVYVHGAAADAAVRGGSPRSLLARDLVAHLPAAYASLEG